MQRHNDALAQSAITASVEFRDREYPAYFYRFRHYEIWALIGRTLKAFLELVWQAL